jgi:hypothetical protein
VQQNKIARVKIITTRMWMRARPKAWVLALDLWGSGNRPEKLKQRSGGVSVRENVANAIQLRVLVLLALVLLLW